MSENENIIRLTNARGVPVVSYDKGETWSRDPDAAPAAPAEAAPTQPAVETPAVVPTPRPAPVVRETAPDATGQVRQGIGGATVPEESFWKKVARGMSDVAEGASGFGSGALEGAGDLGRGYAQGATLGWGDEAQAAMAAPFDPDRAERGIGGARVSSYDALREQERAIDAESEARSPYLYGTGKGAGMATTLAPAAFVAPGGGIAADAAMGILTGGAMAGGESEAETASGVLSDVGSGMATGGLAGGAGGAVVRGAGGLAPIFAKAAKPWADKLRGYAPGAYSGQAKVIAEGHGRERMAAIGDAIERHGIDVRAGLPPVARSAPMGSDVYETQLTEATERIGQSIADSIDEMTTSGVASPSMHLQNRLLNIAKSFESRVGTEFKAQGAKIRSLVDDLRSTRPGKGVTPRELQDLKTDWETLGKYPQDKIGATPEGQIAIAYQEAAKVPRKMLEEAFEKNRGLAAAETYRAAKRDFGLLNDARIMARGRTAAENANQIVSLPTTVLMAGGVAGGASHGWPGALAGMAATGLGTAAVKKYGKDALADAGRAAQRAGEGVGRASRAAGNVGGVVGAATQSQNEADKVLSVLKSDPRAFGNLSGAVENAAANGDLKRLRYLIAAARRQESQPGVR
jgi:hypothetical protein